MSASEMQSNFISADTRDTSKSNSMYYELLCNNGNSNYWLASRYVGTTSSFAGFGLRYVMNGDVMGSNIFNSYDYEDNRGRYIRTVISLDLDVINIDEGYDENNGGWQLTN